MISLGIIHCYSCVWFDWERYGNEFGKEVEDQCREESNVGQPNATEARAPGFRQVRNQRSKEEEKVKS